MNDPIGDFIIRLKNGSDIGKESIVAPFSKMKLAIAKLLLSKKYIAAVNQKNRDGHDFLEVILLYGNNGKDPAISGVQRISKPSRRLYESAKNIKRFRKGYGLSVFSTPKGILADTDAKEQNVGGEFLFNIW